MTRQGEARRAWCAKRWRSGAGEQFRLIRKVMVANRGEVACRIMRTCRAMGVATVAVFSDADAGARHVREADEATRIGSAEPGASYLNIAALVAAARRTGADALHPGYGFLAEDAAFAEACADAGLTFIGPAPQVIRQMGSKREAKRLAEAAGVPVVPGYAGAEQDAHHLTAAARAIGFPLLIKASAGGGGRGMRVVERVADLQDTLASARREAESAFGDGTLLLERLIPRARHIEVQIFGDEHGHLVHLGERECTIQRRHQKLIEETPSAAVTPELRARMTAAALALARQLGYTNAGTVEFVLAPDGAFYFLEVNTRLQVEHPVTELVTGLDLVRWQIEVAEGRPLPLAQEAITFTGNAIEARIYAEDPGANFLPASGQIALWREPEDSAVRVESGIGTSDMIPPHYDGLLAKVAVHSATRAEALRRLERALAHTTVLGLPNNIAYLRGILLHPAHMAGDLSTGFVAEHHAALAGAFDVAATGAGLAEAAVVAAVARALAQPEPRGWHNNPGMPPAQRFAGAARGNHLADSTTAPTIAVCLVPGGAQAYAAHVSDQQGERTLAVRVHRAALPDLALELDGRLVRAIALEAGGVWWLKLGDETYRLAWVSPFPTTLGRAAIAHALAAPMPGTVAAVHARAGQRVRQGDALVTLLAMKIEHVIVAPAAGVVEDVRFAVGATVPAGAQLLEFAADA
jgi:acetyl-CoA carboxylase biotin carboxylase subunit